MNTLCFSRFGLRSLGLIAVMMFFALMSSAQNSPDLPVISITGPSHVREYCPPNMDCIGLGFTLRRTGPGLDQSLTVFLRYEGIAVPGSDYVALPSQVIFEAGRELAFVSSAPIDDTLFEGDETLVAQIMVGLNYGVNLEQWQATTILLDNEPPAPPVVSLELVEADAMETWPFQNAIFWAEFRVSRTGPATNELVVFLATAGRARLGEDYRLEPSLNGPAVRFFPGVRSVNVRLYPIDDEIYEATESAMVRLLPAPADASPFGQYQIDSTHAYVAMAIRDNDPPATVLRINAPKDQDRFLEGETIRVDVTAIDLQGAITHVELFDNEIKIGQSIINFVRAPDPGTPIDHFFEWRGASVGLHTLTARAVSTEGDLLQSEPLRVYVDGGPPIVSIVATRAVTAEPCPVCFVAPGIFTISRTGKTNNTLAVWYLLGGTARNGEDYARLSGEVLIPAGSNSVQVMLLPILDDLREGDETVVVQLILPPFAGPVVQFRIDPEHSAATITIRDSLTTPPGPPIVSITASDAFAREGTNGNLGTNTATFVLHRTGPTNESLSVHVAIGGTASNGVDYASIASPVVFKPGQRRVSVVIRPFDDNAREPVETVVVTLLGNNSSIPTYEIGTPRHAAAVIVDNDRPRPMCGRLPDGRFNLCLPTAATHCYRVEVSDDLKAWTAVCMVPVNEGAAQFVDPDGEQPPGRFYRLIPVACEIDE